MRCRLLPHLVADGPTQMGLDHALLDAADARPVEAALRTYEWSVPTLSLGYFQAIAEAQADPRWRGVPVVRRSTGGGALWHHHELTYALVLPRAHPAAQRASDLYRSVHAALAALLVEAGFAARLRGGPGPDDSARFRPFLCFTGRDPADIVIGAWKVLGSAQRRRPGAVLQHGSLLLARSDRTPELPGLGGVAGDRPSASVWSRRFRQRLPAALGLEPAVAAPTPAEATRAAELARQLYASPDWTRRR